MNSMTTTTSDWTKNSWRSFPALQQPVWPEAAVRDESLAKLARLPALVFAGESRSLIQQLADVAAGKAFVLQAGDCSEDFSRCHGPHIHDLLKVILQMSIILAYSGEKKVVKIGRMAGQYAKPRSSDTETVNGIEIPSFRGDMINSAEPTLKARTPDPRRVVEGYFRAAATLNLVRAFTKGGYAGLNHLHSWSVEHFPAYTAKQKYEEIIKGIRKAISFTNALGLDTSVPQINETTIYTSHEALLLEYEEALTRVDTTTGLWYDTSAHMLWLGDRTRQVHGAHVEYLRGICNPLGVKIGPKHDLDDIKRLIEKLNPENKPGRLSLIVRMGAEKVATLLPPLIHAVQAEGFHVVWLSDPMHGNTYVNSRGQKTRHFETILQEIREFWNVHHAEGTNAGGVHIELTGENVTECVGGSAQLRDKDLELNYQTSCDPRLNPEQAVELAFELSQILNPTHRL